MQYLRAAIKQLGRKTFKNTCVQEQGLREMYRKRIRHGGRSATEPHGGFLRDASLSGNMRWMNGAGEKL